MRKTENTSNRLRLLAYSGPAIPLSILLMPLFVYLPPFYAQEIGLNLTVIGSAFFIARVWDAVTDPMIGWASDQTRSRWGRRKPWIVCATPILMIATYFLLLPQPGVSGIYLAIWFAVFYLAWTGVQIPYLSWGAEFSDDYFERNKVVGYRETGTMVGMLLATGLPLWILDPDQFSYRQVLEVFAVSTFILLPITVFTAVSSGQSVSTRSTPAVTIRKLATTVLHNKPLARFLCATVFLISGLTVFDAVILLFLEHVYQNVVDYLYLVFVQYCIAIVAAPAAVYLANKYSKHRVICFSILMAALSAVLLWFAGPHDEPVLLLSFCIAGLALSAIRILPTSVMADIADYGTLRHGTQQTGIYMAAYNLAYKVSGAFGVFVAMTVLDFGGFDPAAVEKSTAPTILRVVTCVLPVAITLPALLLLWHYPITAKKHDAIRRWIERANRPA